MTRYLAAAWRRRDDLRAAFPDPLGADAPAFVAWAWTSGVREGLITADLLHPETPGPPPYLLAIHALRPDLQAQFPDPRGEDAHGLVVWGWTTPEGIDPGLLGPPPDRAARLRLARSRARRRAAAVYATCRSSRRCSPPAAACSRPSGTRSAACRAATRGCAARSAPPRRRRAAPTGPTRGPATSCTSAPPSTATTR